MTKLIFVENLPELLKIDQQSLEIGQRAVLDTGKLIYEWRGDVGKWHFTGQYYTAPVPTPVKENFPATRNLAPRRIKNPANSPIILDYVSIHQPVADVTALNAIPTGSLGEGDLCLVVADGTMRQWDGTAWILIGTYLFVANSTARLALTSSEVNDGQLVVQFADHSVWIAMVSGSTVTWSQIGGPGSYDPFTALVDGVGTANGHYVSEGTAIAAGNSVIYTTGGTSDSQLNFLPAVKDIVDSLDEFEALPTNDLENNVSILIRNSSTVHTWGITEEQPIPSWKELLSENLKVGTLCLVDSHKQYFYWDGSNWLSPEEAGEVHPFYKLTDNAVINITRNIYIYRNGDLYHLSNQTGFNVSANCALTIYSPSNGNQDPNGGVNGATLLCNNPNGTPFIQGSGTVNISGITLIQGSTGTFVANTIRLLMDGCNAQTFGANNQFLGIQAFGSKIKNTYILGQAIGSAVDNSVVIGNGCKGESIEYRNQTGSTGTHVTVQDGGELDGIKGSGQTGGGGFPFVVLNQGELKTLLTSYPISPKITNDGGTLSGTSLVTATGFAAVTATLTVTDANSRINNMDFTNVDITVDSTSTNAVFFECNTSGGSYTDNGTNTQGLFNTGGLLPDNISGSFDPFTAKATTFDTLIAATNSGKKVINVDGAITFQGDIATNFDTYLFLSPGSRLDMGVHSWDKRSNGLQIVGTENNVITWASNADTSPFIDTSGFGFSMSIENCLLGNIGTAANTPLCDPTIIPVQLINCGFSDNGQVNSGVVFAQGGYADNVAFESSASTSEDIAVFENGSWGRKLTVYNIGGSTNSLININLGAPVEGLIGGNGNNLITNNGILQNASNNTAVSGAGTLDLNCGANSQTINCTVRNSTIEGSNSMNLGSIYSGSFIIQPSVVGTLIADCYGFGGTYTDNGSGTIDSGNKGYFPTNSNGISAFTGKTTPTVGLSNLYTAGEKCDLIAVNTTESANTTLAASDELAATINQAATWNQAGNVINGSAGGVSFTLQMIDSSSVYKYTMATTSQSGTLTGSSNSVTGLTSTADLIVGMPVSGTGIQSGTVIATIVDATSITLSLPATTGGAQTLTFTSQPFLNFDSTSTLVINGNGATIQNTSTVPNTCITMPANGGTGIVRDCYFILPDVSNSGVTTTAYGLVDNCEFFGGGSACDTAITVNGGKLQNIVINGAWKDNANLFGLTNIPAIYDTIHMDVNASLNLPTMGVASAISRNFDPSYTLASLTLVPSSYDQYSNVSVDFISFASGVTNCKITNAYLDGVMAFSSDNTNIQINCVNGECASNQQVYGKVKFTNWDFNGGISAMPGSEVWLDNCTSATPIVINTGAIVHRQNNDLNIGNDFTGRAYANFSSTGGVITIFDSYNVDTIVLDSTGQYTVTFLHPLETATYPITISASDGNVGTGLDTCIFTRCGQGDRTTSTVKIGTINQILTAFSNCDSINFIIP